MKLTQDQVRHVARLARLNLSDSDIARYTEELTAILNYVEKLNGVNTLDISPTFHTIPVKNVLREDEIKPSLQTSEFVNLAPDHDSRALKVPKIIEVS